MRPMVINGFDSTGDESQTGWAPLPRPTRNGFIDWTAWLLVERTIRTAGIIPVILETGNTAGVGA